ncbi:aquaporin-7 isoform X3 [Mus musculus]|uniref:aquaporin-7 isoform X3 n=1 Tax=Mus musculus TaxID=10090 RepID=UPI0005AB950F|nr:aquaporin-7 isoform X3 [Mus musculus]
MAPRSVLETIQSVLQKNMVREFLAEFLSTYVMMVFGLGSVAHMVLGENSGSYLGVNLGFGFGVTMGVHVAGGISGAINHFAGGDLLVTGSKATANIFATYLPEYMTLWRGFLDEAFVTGMLQLCLFAITDKKNSPALQGTEPLVIGILVTVLGVSLGMNSGYAINPSRDLPPRLFTFIAGWGKQVFRPPSFCLQSRKQLVVGAGGGTTSGRLPRWYCIPGFNSPQHTTGSSETGEFYSKRPEGNCIIQECSFCKHKWLCASRALLSRASL